MKLLGRATGSFFVGDDDVIRAEFED